MMPCQGKLLSYLTFLSMKEVLERGEKSKGILSRRQHWDNSVPDTLGSRSGFDKDPHPTEQLAKMCNRSQFKRLLSNNRLDCWIEKESVTAPTIYPYPVYHRLISYQYLSVSRYFY